MIGAAFGILNTYIMSSQWLSTAAQPGTPVKCRYVHGPQPMNSPRIATITAFPLGIPFDHWASPPMFAGRPRTTLDTVLVQVTTDQGTVGWGEAYGSFWSAVVPAIEQWVSPLAIGQKVDDVELPARIERTLHNLGRAGATVHAVAGELTLNPAGPARLAD